MLVAGVATDSASTIWRSIRPEDAFYHSQANKVPCFMTAPLLFPLPGNELLAANIAARFDAELGDLEVRHFPDRETYVRYRTPPARRRVILIATLADPDAKFLPLAFAASAARDLGAASVGIVCPYLAYMRQDRRFHEGEAITSAHFAKLLSQEFDWLVTLDPHLHRYPALDAIYTIPAKAVRAAPLIGKWIRDHIEAPVLIGPDTESEQWVSEAARVADAPHTTLTKVRRGDRNVSVSLPDKTLLGDRQPVVVDDIASSSRTLIETVRTLLAAGTVPPICIVTHGIFAGDSHLDLLKAGAAKVVSTYAIPHPTNAIDVSAAIAEAIEALHRG